MKLSFLTTYRGGDKSRLMNLENVIRTISTDFPDWEIVVVEQDEKSTLSEHPLVKAINYLHVFNMGPFNKSWGMNVAFKQSCGDVLVVSDADMIVEAEDLSRAVNACESELDAVRPYGQLIDMTAEQTAEYMQYAELPVRPEKSRGYNREHASESLCMAGGIFVITREFFARTGGMDERFSGWGGEDDAMSIKLQRMSARTAIAKNTLGWHLWHPRESRYEHEDYLRNSQLLQQYRDMNKTDIALLCRNQYTRIGNVNKYCASEQEAPIAAVPPHAQSALNNIVRWLPENYGTVTQSGVDDLDRVFGIVITTCGRSEYLKQCLASLGKSDLSRAVICIVDETEAAKVEVEGFSCFEGIDYPEMDIKQVEHDIDSMLCAISHEKSCNLFNEQGWLKREIQSPSQLQKTYSRHGLYVRNTYLDENPAIADILHELKNREDKKTAELIREFSIEGVPVIKIFKQEHRNMFDSLRAGWDCLAKAGCKYLVNLDSDAIVNTNWLDTLASTYELYKDEQPAAPLIVSGFNSDKHVVLQKNRGYVLKRTIGGINLFFHEEIYQQIVRPVLNIVNWDDALSKKIIMRNGKIVATVPSVVQHIGKFGYWSRPQNFDVADDFIEQDV